MKKIVVITTGGTIAMAESGETRGVRPQDPRALQSALPLLARHADVEMEHLFNKPSPHITPEDMYEIALRVNKHLSRSETDGVVVTHGTDTLEETAYYLDLVIHSNKPVVVTALTTWSIPYGWPRMIVPKGWERWSCSTTRCTPRSP
jgi:L-asparaginase